MGGFGDFKDCYVSAHTPDKVVNTEESVEEWNEECEMKESLLCKFFFPSAFSLINMNL